MPVPGIDENPVPLENAIRAFHHAVEITYKEYMNKDSEAAVYKAEEILRLMARPDVETGELCVLPSATFRVIDQWSSAILDKDASVLHLETGVKVDRIVDIDEFVCSKDYMGQRRWIRPRVRKEINRLFNSEHSEDYLEVILTGSIGYGKSYMSQLGVAYMLYRLSCYHCPQIEFGLAPGTSIVFIMQSAKLELAKKVLFAQFGGMLRQSPYFNQHFPFDPNRKSELQFPNDISLFPISGSDTAALGMNVFGGILDELNFMARVEKSSKGRFTGEQEYDQAEKLYSTALRRIKSRFQFAGRVPGKLFLISSSNYPGDFTDRKLKEAAQRRQEGKRETIFVVSMSQWEGLAGTGRLSEETFLVEIGDETRRSRILLDMEEAVDKEAVIEVPVDYRDDFERDLEGAIRDLAGRPVGGSNVLIKHRDKIHVAGVRHEERFDGKQLFIMDQVDLTRFDGRTYELLNEEYLDLLFETETTFVAHGDLALTGDSAGLAVSHFDGFVEVGASWNWDEGEKKYAQSAPGRYPSYCVDGVLKIIPPRNDEIDLNLVGDLLHSIASRLNLAYVTADQFQSAQLLQRARKLRNVYGKRIKSGNVSMDKQLGPYMECKQAFRDSRLIMPNTEVVKKEFRELIFDPAAQKIDHPPEGSKDVSDAVAGTVFVLMMKNQPRGTVTARAAKKEKGEPEPLTAFKKARPRSGRRRLY